jgi:hypothetical protein
MIVILVLSPFLYSGFTADILRWSGKVPVYSESLQMWANGQLIRAEQDSRTLLFHHNLMISFYFRKCIILFISDSVVGIILIPGNFTGNASFKNEIAPSFPILCKFKLLVTVREKLLKALATVPGTRKKETVSARLNVLFWSPFSQCSVLFLFYCLILL